MTNPLNFTRSQAIMTDKEIRSNYARICESLSARRLKPAFDMLGKLITDNGLGFFYDEHRNLEETYHNMLRYTVEGVSDPERQKIYRKLIVSVFGLADKVKETLLMKFSPSIQYGKKRMFKESYIDNPDQFIAGLEEYYITGISSSSAGENEKSGKDMNRVAGDEKSVHEASIRFFNHIWFTDKPDSSQIKAWNRFISGSVLPAPYRSLMISALMLSLQRYFDPQKMNLLFDICNSGDAVLSQRALVGLLINLYRYDKRIFFYPEITGRLKIMNENPGFRGNLGRIIIQFIRSKGTEELQKKIREEIIPEMIRISPNLKNKMNLDSLMEDGLSDDKNPDWEDIFKDSPGLLNKMEEFSEMQMEGDDVFMGSFSMLKNFPFFDELTNWFMPFFPENPDIPPAQDLDEGTVRHLYEAIEQAPVLCNSDKYSFCLSLPRLPKENLSFMTQALQAEMEQLKEMTADEEMLDPDRKAEFASNQYIQDLYRFYKLFPRKNDFDDIFGWRLDFHNTQSLGPILKEDRKVMREIAEYYLIKEHYEEASEILATLLEEEKNEELYQKMAWSYQKRGDYTTALDYYLKAEMHGANNMWNIRKIALCYRHLKEPDKALDYYRTAEKLDSENLGIQVNIGHCLLELGRYEEALKTYFKVEYLSPGNTKVWRPIGWCSFLTGKKKQAEKYFQKLVDEQPNQHDLMSMGHVQWSLGNRKQALEYYRRSISGKGFSEPEFLDVFEEDLPHLIDQGVDKDDVPIMLDQLRYYVEG